ncbi:hypothetical protein TSOC_008744, partial [Tetrabaena socialis]
AFTLHSHRSSPTAPDSTHSHSAPQLPALRHQTSQGKTMDTAKETVAKAGHRVEEAATAASHTAQELGDKLVEAVTGGKHETESAAMKTSHAADEAALAARHLAEETAEKAQHAAAIHSKVK